MIMTIMIENATNRTRENCFRLNRSVMRRHPSYGLHLAEGRVSPLVTALLLVYSMGTAKRLINAGLGP
jgi:hypothetical protein